MRRSCLAILLLAASVALAQGMLEVITLRHRTADQVIPVLRPLLEPGGALSGQSNQLIVRAGAANLAQIRSALEAIDQPQRRLTISVRFDRARDSTDRGIQADARISNRGSAAQLRIQDAASSRDEQVDQRIQVLEGGQAYISTGEARIYAQAGTGFAVVPRVSGSQVSLEIATQQDAFTRGGAIRGEQAVSTVSGRLGEWIELAGASGTSARADHGMFSARERTAREDRRIWVKVEELR